MNYNFDEIIERNNTNCVKYENSRLEEPELPEDFIPLWIADMDFACPQPILDAMHNRINKRIFGYSDIIDSSYKTVLENWMLKKKGWKIQWEDVVISAGVVPAISNLICLLTEEREGVIIQPPLYPPFYSVVVSNNRTPVYAPLICKQGEYEIDFEILEEKVKDPANKVLIFCSPHNPTGRVWREEEIRRLVDLCMEHDVCIISDEIHQDILRKGEHHIPLAKLYPQETRIFTCTAPSKTFNMAGNHFSHIFIPDEEIREKWEEKYHYLPNPISIEATKAAYEKCEEWVDAMNEYIDGNFKFLKEYLEKNLPQARLNIPQGTYLAWIDMSGFGLKEEDVVRTIIRDAGVHIESGEMFRSKEKGYIRVNLACPRSVLEKALDRITGVLV